MWLWDGNEVWFVRFPLLVAIIAFNRTIFPTCADSEKTRVYFLNSFWQVIFTYDRPEIISRRVNNVELCRVAVNVENKAEEGFFVLKFHF